MDENDAVDVDALFSGAFPEVPDTEPAAEPAAKAAPTPGALRAAGEGEPAAPKATEPARATVPAKTAADSETAKPADAAQGAPAPEEARLAKIENDLALAKKAQAAADRKNAELVRQNTALTEARVLERQRIEQLIAANQLTVEEVNKGPQLMEAWVARDTALAAQETQERERLAESAATETARAEREAEIYFKEQAVPLLAEAIELGLSKSDVDHEALLRKALETPDRQADIALTWRISDPQEQARISQRVMDGALAEAKAAIVALAEAKATTAQQKADRSRFDRTTAAGPAAGGRETLPSFTTPEDDIAAHYAQAGI